MPENCHCRWGKTIIHEVLTYLVSRQNHIPVFVACIPFTCGASIRFVVAINKWVPDVRISAVPSEYPSDQSFQPVLGGGVHDHNLGWSMQPTKLCVVPMTPINTYYKSWRQPCLRPVRNDFPFLGIVGGFSWPGLVFFDGKESHGIQNSFSFHLAGHGRPEENPMARASETDTESHRKSQNSILINTSSLIHPNTSSYTSWYILISY